VLDDVTLADLVAPVSSAVDAPKTQGLRWIPGLPPALA
jgi:hypothetical protein